MRDEARLMLTQNLAARAEAIDSYLQPGETLLASSAGDLHRVAPPLADDATTEEVLDSIFIPDGDFVLTDARLIYRDSRSNVAVMPLESVTRWHQKVSRAYNPSRRILDIDFHLSDGRVYLVVTGKVFAKQIRKAGKIRRSFW
ncbi:hypothetical protein [Streptacidiphilus sp. EB103A]|uniref:hypothetical protein n=1 Tax=Streptacidiphilus sp. EB103A TaxID=3156275 RepID=UPI0035199656